MWILCAVFVSSSREGRLFVVRTGEHASLFRLRTAGMRNAKRFHPAFGARSAVS